MKSLSLLSFLCLILFTLTGNAQTEETKIKAVVSSMTAGYNAKDVSAMFANATDNIVMAGPFSSYSVGKAKAQAAYTQAFQSYLKEEKSEQGKLEIIITSPNTAQVLVNSNVKNPMIGASYENQALINMSLVKINGDWKVASATVILNPHQSILEMTEANR
jgi:ketosteroid isomerase-like protein